MSTKNIRLAFTIDKEMEEKILALRARKEFRRLTISEILRRLIAAGLDDEQE